MTIGDFVFAYTTVGLFLEFERFEQQRSVLNLFLWWSCWPVMYIQECRDRKISLFLICIPIVWFFAYWIARLSPLLWFWRVK